MRFGSALMELRESYSQKRLKDEESKQFFDSIIEVGTVSAAAKAVIAMLKNIPGINLGASVLNAFIAGSIVAALGEGTIYAFEQIYLGNKTFEDIDWVKKVLESKLSLELVEKVKAALGGIGNDVDIKDIAEIIANLFTTAKK